MAVRTDLGPLTKRWPALGQPVEAHWSGGTMGDNRAPGLSTYWVDAVVVVTPQAMAKLTAVDGLHPAGPPQLVPKIQEKVPGGRLLTSDELVDKFILPNFQTTPYLVDGTDTVILVMIGGN